jgi:hypothetical protein
MKLSLKTRWLFKGKLEYIIYIYICHETKLMTFTLDNIKSMLNKNLGGILGGTQC